MFRITTETCRAFTFAEFLILVAINVESSRAAASETASVDASIKAHALGQK